MKSLWVFVGFIVGIITALFIFEVVPFQFAIRSSLAEIIIAIGTVGAVVVAIWGDWIKRGIFRSNIKISGDLICNQLHNGVNQAYVRLLFTNEGSVTAEEIEVYVNKVQDNKNERKPFLPVPLKWTHSNESRRDLHSKQFGYLDLCGINNINNFSSIPKFQLAAGGNVSQYRDIRTTSTEVELVVFQKWGRIKKFEVIIEWKKAKQHKFLVKNIKEI